LGDYRSVDPSSPQIDPETATYQSPAITTVRVGTKTRVRWAQSGGTMRA
jgi:hypothetical protein